MTESVTGLVLRLRPLTETSLIIHWLTPELGRLATVAKGARRPRSAFRGKLDLFYLVDFNFHRSRRSDLHTLREVSLRETNEALRADLAYLQQAAYCAVLIEQTTETETPLPAIYELMRAFLAALPQHPAQPLTIFAFEMKLLQELGLAPNLSENKLTPGTRKILAELMEKDWSALPRLKPSTSQTLEIQRFLQGFLIQHLGKVPAGRTAALQA